MKWIGVIVLVIVGALAAYVAIEYFTVSIHSVPSYIPGQRNVNGHYHTRGALAGLIAIVALAGSAVLAYRIVRQGEPEAEPDVARPTGDSADQLLGSSETDPNG